MAELVIKLVNGELAGKTFQGITKDVNEASLALKKAEVGTQAWVDAAAKLDKAKQVQADYKTQLESTSKASDALKQSFGGILNQIPGFSQLKGVFDQASGGVGGLASGLKGLIAIPVIAVFSAIVAIIGALTAAMKTDDETADAFGKVWAQIGSVFDVVLRRIGLVGRALLDFTKGDWGKGFDKLKDSVSGVGDELERAWELTGKLQDQQNQLDDDVNKFNATEQGLKNTIDAMIIQSKDRSKTEAERIALETQAEALLQQMTKDRMALTERQSAIDVEAIGLKHNLLRKTDELTGKVIETTQQYGLRLLENSQIGGDEAKKISESIKKIDEAQGESLKTLEKLQNQRNALLDKQEADAQKRREEELKKQEKLNADKEKLYQEDAKTWAKIEDDKIALMEDSRDKDLAKLKLSLEREIEALNVNSPTYAAALASAQELARKQRDEINTKWDAKEKTSTEGLLHFEELNLSKRVNALNEAYLDGSISQQKYLQLSEQAIVESERKKLEILKKAHGVESKEYQDQYKKILDQDLKFSQEHAKQVSQATLSTINTLGNIFGSLAVMQNEGSEDAKNLMVAQAIMSSIAGSINAYTSTAQIPIVGPVLAPIAAAIALATGISNVNKIKSTPIPKSSTEKQKAEYGMVISGPSHAQGGIPIEAEGDEIIMTKGVYRNPYLRNLASQINVAGGGISFASGGPVNPYSDISRSPVGSSSSMSSYTAIIERLERSIDATKDLVKATNGRIDRFEVHNNVQETQKQMDRIKQIQNDANI